MEDLTEIYNDLIMEHSTNSYNKRELENATACKMGHNPNCGDEIKLEIKVNGDIIEDLAFTGHGCAISQASTSIMIDTLTDKTIQIFNLKEKEEYIKEVAILEYEEWAEKPEKNKTERIERKTNRIKNNLDNKEFCKLILLKNKELIGFISIFPNDCDECPGLTPWYATMYVKKKYRGKGYSKILNEALLKEAKKRGYKEIFLKTELNNYYEKFGATYIRKLQTGEKLYKIEL